MPSISKFGIIATSLIITITSINSVQADQSDTFVCNDQIYKNDPPYYPKADQSYPERLCYTEFATLHSGLSKTPLWSAEKLTKERIEKSIALKGRFQFFADPHLQWGATPNQYARSGYDRGHAAPSNNMSTPESRLESFSMGNIFPQHPSNNRGLWFKIEYATRSLVLNGNEAYVVTGVYFGDENVKQIGGSVIVPDHVFKAIYLPEKQKGGVYFSKNSDENDYAILSLKEFESITGIKPFPSLSEKIKSQQPDLPEPGGRK